MLQSHNKPLHMKNTQTSDAHWLRGTCQSVSGGCALPLFLFGSPFVTSSARLAPVSTSSAVSGAAPRTPPTAAPAAATPVCSSFGTSIVAADGRIVIPVVVVVVFGHVFVSRPGSRFGASPRVRLIRAATLRALLAPTVALSLFSRPISGARARLLLPSSPIFRNLSRYDSIAADVGNTTAQTLANLTNALAKCAAALSHPLVDEFDVHLVGGVIEFAHDKKLVFAIDQTVQPLTLAFSVRVLTQFPFAEGDAAQPTHAIRAQEGFVSQFSELNRSFNATVGSLQLVNFLDASFENCQTREH